jgi:hypothetical protein
MLQKMILAQTKLISGLQKQLLRATSQAEKEDLERQIEVEVAQLNGVYEDFRDHDCSQK